MTPEEAQKALLDVMKEAREWYGDHGVEWDDAAKDEVAFRFYASERYLGPLCEESFSYWLERNVYIQTKDARLIKFRPNIMQRRFLRELFSLHKEGKPVRIVILKARQFGFSTLIQILCFFFTATRRNTCATVISHKKDSTDHLFEISRRCYRGLRYKPRKMRSNRKMMAWAHPWDSKIVLETAEGQEAGRSATNSILHASEIAFWKDATRTWLALSQTVGDYPGTMIFQESTANGIGNTFYSNYMSAKERKSRYIALFFPWHENPEYAIPVTQSHAEEIMSSLDDEEQAGVEQFGWTPEQVLWRRFTIEEKCEGDIALFHQEYPATDMEAFLVSGNPVFDQALVQHRLCEARKRHPIFVGVIGYRPA